MMSVEELINNLEIGIFRYSLDAKGQFIFVNRAFAKLMGYEIKDLLSMSFSGICENIDELNRIHTKICSEGSVNNEWIRLKRQDGRSMQCAMKAALVDHAEGKNLLIDGVIEDITEHKKAREGLLQAKIAAEEANTAKSMFLANMSHEVRTPMNAVIGMLDLTLETPLTEDQKDNLLTAKEAADNLLSLLNDILDISRVEAGKVILEAVEFDLWRLVESVTKGLSVLAHKKNIQLRYSISDDVPNHVMGDPTRLRQIIINLVNNAIKFTHEGSVDIRVDAASLDDDKLLATFSVADTGIGIPQDKQEGIFDIFTQADASTTRKFGGTGLGLAISKRLVEMMNGRIWIESQQGVGSKFFFTVQLKAQQGQAVLSSTRLKTATSSAQREALSHELRILKVLLVEDNKLNQKIATKLLEKRGWLVDLAEDGQQALDRINAKKFDVVLMDVQMPVLDGLEATRLIRLQEQQSKEHLPIVAMTAKAMSEDENKCLEAGMDAYVAKPFDAAKVFATIDQVLRKDSIDGS